jgi:DNA repair protein RecO (recombination protein O)
VYHREHANLNRIREIRCLHPYQSIHHDVVKSTIAMFVAEVINKVVKEESHARELCDFLISSMITLDKMTSDVLNFHLVFMLKLARFLGFGAHHINEVLGGRITDPVLEKAIQKMLDGSYLEPVVLTTAQRREVLNLILAFYNDHTGSLGEMKSLQVLREILA